MKLFFLSITIFFSFFISVNAGELSSGKSGEADSAPSKSNYVPNDGNCPTLLKKWVDDDFSDTYSWGIIKFKSEAKTCQSSVKSYQDYLKNKQRSSYFSGASSIGNHFSAKFKDQIHPSYQQRFLKDCDKLPPEKAMAIQTRFYAASARIDAVNASILDEVSYYDSVLPNTPSVLHGVECTPILPENNKKCTDYKIQAHQCNKDRPKRFENLVVKTKTNLRIIEDLIRAHRNCITKISAEPGALAGRGYSARANAKIKESCDPFLQAIEIKKNETPWVRGEIFNKIAIKKRPDQRRYIFATEYDFSDKKIEKAMQDQMSASRKSLTDRYQNNLENFRCLTSSVKNNGESCDFKKIRTDLSNLPDLSQTDFSYKNAKEVEAKTYLDAETCLLNIGQDREETRSKINRAGIEAGLGLLTLGVGAAISTGVKVVNAASRVRGSLYVANGALGATLTTRALKETYESCAEETKLVTDLSSKSQVTLENICSDPKSALSQAREKESDCLMSGLLLATNVLPFAGTVPGLMKVVKKPMAPSATEAVVANKTAVADIAINRSAKSAKRVSLEDLKNNSNKIQKAVDSGQIEKAKKLLIEDMKSAGHQLNDKQAAAIIRAHTDEAAACIVGKCTPAQLAKKTEIMKEAGLSSEQRRAAIERGWAGRPGEHLVVDGNIPRSGKLTPTQVAQLHTDNGLQLVPGSSRNSDKARAMMAEFNTAAKAERTAAPLSYASGGKEATTVVKYDLLFKDFSSSSTGIRRIRGGEHADLAEDISNVSEHISKLKNPAQGSMAGKEYDQLIQREMEAMSRQSQHSLNLSRNKDYPVGEFEAWQFMRARVELARHNMNNGKMSEDFFDKIADELTDFVQKNKMQKQVEIWQKVEFSLRHN